MGKIFTAGMLMAALLFPMQARADFGVAPIVNTIQGATSIFNLNFGMPGVRQQIAVFVINSNDDAGFHVDFTFANKGYFKTGTRQFAMTSVILSQYGGTLGAGFVPMTDVALTIDPGTGIATWIPSGTPTASTDNLVVAIYASWADHSSGLAGFYLENITASIASGP